MKKTVKKNKMVMCMSQEVHSVVDNIFYFSGRRLPNKKVTGGGPFERRGLPLLHISGHFCHVMSPFEAANWMNLLHVDEE